MRLFIAVKVSPPVLYQIESFFSRAVEQEKNVKWIPPKNMHITLKFLGDTSPAKLESIKQALDSIKHACFELEYRGLGAFPNLRKPNVFWIGVEGDVLQLQALQQSIEQAMKTVGIKPEKRSFSPHLTIGRVRRSPEQSTLQFFEENKDEGFGTDQIVAFHLVESQLTPRGAFYKILHTVELTTTYSTDIK